MVWDILVLHVGIEMSILNRLYGIVMIPVFPLQSTNIYRHSGEKYNNIIFCILLSFVFIITLHFLYSITVVKFYGPLQREL